MDLESGKVKFGFSKIIKKPNLVNQNGKSADKERKIEMIEAIEGSSIKIFGKDQESEADKKLIIPMTNDQRTTPLSKLLEERKRRKIKSEPVSEIKPTDTALIIKQEPIDETLEQQAARELIEDLQNKVIKTEVKIFEVPINPDELPLDGAKESSLQDYDRVPIGDFGKAMLRGMGWKDEDNKEDTKTTMLEGPILRPKGMGLGADKVVKKQPLLIPPNQSETLEIKKNACVKVLAGKHKNFYGTIEGFDDGGGRVIVKLAIGGLKVTLNEFMVQPISKQEFAKYGKILNSEKYNEYKSGAPVTNLTSENNNEKSSQKDQVERSRRSSRDRSSSRGQRDQHKSRDRVKEGDRYKSSRKHHERSRSREKRSRRNSSSSDDHKRKKKSSKHKKHYSSPDSRYSSENEKRHKKKSKRSKQKRDRS